MAGYTGDQVNLEPRHAPETAALRREIYASERKQVTAFEYADVAGYAVVTVHGAQVTAAVHAGSQPGAFQSLKISV